MNVNFGIPPCKVELVPLRKRGTCSRHQSTPFSPFILFFSHSFEIPQVLQVSLSQLVFLCPLSCHFFPFSLHPVEYGLHLNVVNSKWFIVQWFCVHNANWCTDLFVYCWTLCRFGYASSKQSIALDTFNLYVATVEYRYIYIYIDVWMNRLTIFITLVPSSIFLWEKPSI